MKLDAVSYEFVINRLLSIRTALFFCIRVWISRKNCFSLFPCFFCCIQCPVFIWTTLFIRMSFLISIFLPSANRADVIASFFFAEAKSTANRARIFISLHSSNSSNAFLHFADLCHQQDSKMILLSLFLSSLQTLLFRNQSGRHHRSSPQRRPHFFLLANSKT